MGTVKVGNGWYFLYFGIAAAALTTLVLCLRKKRERTVRTVFLVLLFSNLALHWLKQAFPPYIERFPESLCSSALQNLCAVSTVGFPFLYLAKKQNVLHDYAFFIGVCGGLGALCYPTETLGHAPFAFDTLRFYYCHMTLLTVPLSAAILGVYRPRLSRIWAVPLLFLAHQAIICLNDLFLVGIGAFHKDLSVLLDPAWRNSSFTFGIPPRFSWAKTIFDPLVPWFFRTDAFGLNGGTPFYFPVLWMIGPVCVFLPPIYAILTAPFAILARVRRAAATRATAPEETPDAAAEADPSAPTADVCAERAGFFADEP